MKRFNVCAGVCLLGLVLVVGVQGQQREGGGELPAKARLPVAEPEAPGEDGTGTTLGTAPELSVFSVIKFSGVLKHIAGQPRTGLVGITFALYPEQEGGAPLWLETQNVQADAQGRYTVLLGALQAEGLPRELFTSGEARWLGIEVQGEAEQARILLVSVPYALKAAEAETLAGRSASEFVLAEQLQEEVRREIETQAQQSGGGGSRPNITEAASTFTDNNSTQVVLVQQQGSGAGLRAEATSGRGVFGLALGPTGATQGVWGQSNSSSGRGVLGFVPASSGRTFVSLRTSHTVSLYYLQ